MNKWSAISTLVLKPEAYDLALRRVTLYGLLEPVRGTGCIKDGHKLLCDPQQQGRLFAGASSVKIARDLAVCRRHQVAHFISVGFFHRDRIPRPARSSCCKQEVQPLLTPHQVSGDAPYCKGPQRRTYRTWKLQQASNLYTCFAANMIIPDVAIHVGLGESHDKPWSRLLAAPSSTSARWLFRDSSSSKNQTFCRRPEHVGVAMFGGGSRHPANSFPTLSAC